MSHHPFDQRNLNWFFGISILVLLVVAAYLIGLVHLTYRDDMAEGNRGASMMPVLYR